MEGDSWTPRTWAQEPYHQPPSTDHRGRRKPDELPVAPAVALPECYPTLDLYWEGGNIFDSDIGSHPESCTNPWYDTAAWALPAEDLEQARVRRKPDVLRMSVSCGVLQARRTLTYWGAPSLAGCRQYAGL